ncbi:hydroxysqualene dehydroxylase HpnE [Azospirillum soli]|uniref:hydroxysqualene dehydroxylase HpnE n=1 Tax=Azospirillum soli TaxID=1304799 RepID=UPI001AE79695|nr:hydroxysqualene dehydroxylase HpnE [Azospirillum soli]MBP2316020.1 squalene-associated FAD-dependent desaturase [Azospirillum soli]
MRLGGDALRARLSSSVVNTIHIVGTGLAGLAAATRLTAAGQSVVLYESAPQAGGRCRSFFDSTLGCTVDNGSHLVLSGNRSLLGYLDRIGARDRLTELRPATFPFLDLRSGERWTLRPGGLWLFDPARRVPDSRPADYLTALKAVVARPDATVADVLPPTGPLYERLWHPLAVSVMNGAPNRVSARLFGSVLRETLLRGEAACRPLIAEHGLSTAFVEPSLAWLEQRGVSIRFGARLDGLETVGGRVAALSVAGTRVELAEGDSVILAVPAWIAEKLVPGLTAPPPGRAIVNAHFRLDQAPALSFLGLIGGTAEWLFGRGNIVSVTVSDADALAEQPADLIAARLWADVARALSLTASPPPFRVVKEKRATPDQAPEHAAKRPGPRTAFSNLVLAGDWTETGLPATLEGAVRSGERAAEAILSPRFNTFARLGLFPAFTLLRRRPI